MTYTFRHAGWAHSVNECTSEHFHLQNFSKLLLSSFLPTPFPMEQTLFHYDPLSPISLFLGCLHDSLASPHAVLAFATFLFLALTFFCIIVIYHNLVPILTWSLPNNAFQLSSCLLILDVILALLIFPAASHSVASHPSSIVKSPKYNPTP